ncbi:MAG: hypothetical protein QOF76_3358, partial [Solirubrobacteraceae bacterium]|nr:hypothetical protein [Solirubrobacteraceae bacterium]
MVAPARRDGSALSCRAQISTFEHDDHGPVWLAIFSDIAETLAPGEASTTRGMVLPGRGTLQEDLRRELARARRTQSPVAVAMLGLDDEIDFRDSGTIDELAKATEAWPGTLRDSDTIAHYEFSQFDYAVLMPDCAPDQAQMVTERARRATPDGQACSAGFACWDGDEGGVELTARAFKALKMARSRGGGLTMPALT